MRILKLIAIIFISYFCVGFDRPGNSKEGACRTHCSDGTKLALDKMDSLFKGERGVEFKYIGEAGKKSKMYMLYADLLKVATEKELMDILDCEQETVSVRGYAYMAYVYLCDKEKKKEKQFNYNFSVFVLNGCIGSNCSFPAFVKKVHSRRAFDPDPPKYIVNSEEKQVIEMENKIRKEQGGPGRKE
jgi:hypothetical protein